jgi:hypothetical protein
MVHLFFSYSLTNFIGICVRAGYKLTTHFFLSLLPSPLTYYKSDMTLYIACLYHPIIFTLTKVIHYYSYQMTHHCQTQYRGSLTGSREDWLLA